MSLDALDALSPLDGRYAKSTAPLRAHLSESALIRERIRIEADWLVFLADTRPAGLPAAAQITRALRDVAVELAKAPPATAAAAVKAIEQRTNHDVKAVEYYVRDQLASAGASPEALELVHIGCTSEDINNLAYARLLRDARSLLLTEFRAIQTQLQQFATLHTELPMLSRTHGQTASPTTLGKEWANVAARLARGIDRWSDVAVLGKWNGAVGNFNAHVAAAPQDDWAALSNRFVESMGLTHNPLTTQIEPHDWIGEYADALAALDVVLIDFSRDVWGYISLGYLKQRAVAGEVGSSTMPHKVNPIDFENAEGNLGIANAILRHFADKLPLSRWQRDLTDSTVLRNVGVPLAHTTLACQSLLKGLRKLKLNEAAIAADLEANWAVVAEAIQTILRREAYPNPYEALKSLTRKNEKITMLTIHTFIDTLDVKPEVKERLRSISPFNYLGI